MKRIRPGMQALLLALLLSLCLPAVGLAATRAESDQPHQPQPDLSHRAAQMDERDQPGASAAQVQSSYGLVDESGLPAFTWEEPQFLAWPRSALVSIRATASRPGVFTGFAMRVWNPDGALIAATEEKNLSRSGDSYLIWQDIRAHSGALLRPGGTYLCQFEVCFDGCIFRSPEYTLRPPDDDAVRFGLDVSEHQGEIDWETAAAYIDFAILRCGYGSDYAAQDDKQWARNVSACERLGIPYGVYLYSYANSEEKAASEAEHVLRLLDGHTPSLPVYYDLEDPGTVARCSDAELLRYTEIFTARLQEAGCRVGVYSGWNWWNDRLSDPGYDAWDKWMAAWGSRHSAGEGYPLWQYYNQGDIPGIRGDVDLNWFFQEPLLEPYTVELPHPAFVADLDCGGETLSFASDLEETELLYAGLYSAAGRLLDADATPRGEGQTQVRLSLNAAPLPERYTVKLFQADAAWTPLVEPEVWELGASEDDEQEENDDGL